MKKTLQLLLIWILSISAFPAFSQIVGQYVIDDVESTRRATWGNDQAGTLIQPLANPFSASGNSSANVFSYTRNGGVTYDYVVGSLAGYAQDISSYLSGSKKFSLKVYTTAPVNTLIGLSVESHARTLTGGWPAGRHSAYEARTTVQNGWQTLIFDFTWQPDGATNGAQLDQVVFSFDSPSNNSHTYYFDDFKGFNIVAPVVASVPHTEHLWDNFRNVRRLGSYSPLDGALSIVSTPSTVGNANSSTVGKYIRSGIQYDVFSANFDSTLLDLDSYKNNTKKFSVKVYSPAVGTRIGFTLQDSAIALGNYPSGRFAEFNGTTTVANAWETVVLSCTNSSLDGSIAANHVNQMAILVNSNTYSPVTVYLDSLFGPSFAAPLAPVIVGENMIQNFNGDNKLSFGFRNGTLTQPFANDVSSSDNNSSNIAKYVRNAGAYYDVIVCDMLGIATDISNYVNGTKKISMKVYTNAPVGTRVELTLQNATQATNGYPTGRHSVYGANTTVQNGWQTLTFTYFLAPDGSVDINALDQMIISFNPASSTNYTFRFDDIKGFPIVEYNDPTPHYEHTWENFKNIRRVRYGVNSGLSIVANPSITGNNAELVGRYVRGTSATDTLMIKFDSTLLDLPAYRANTKKFSMRVYSPAPNTTIQITLQDSNAIAGSSTAGRYAEFSAATTTTNEWETVVLTYRFTPDGSVGASSVNSAALLINYTETASATVYLDSIFGPKFGTPATPAIVGENMIEDFESVRHVTWGVSAGPFTNNFANPSATGANTSATVGKYVRGGATYDYLVGSLDGQALGIPAYYQLGTKKFSIKVYTTAPVGTLVELTLQNSAQASAGYPNGRHSTYQGRTSVQNGWQTVVLNYAFQPSTGVNNNAIDEFALAFDSPSGNTHTYYIDDLKGFAICQAPALPTISSSSTINSLCSSGGSITLTSSYDFTIWSNGQTGRSITVTTPGTYKAKAYFGSCTSAYNAGVTVVQGVNATPSIVAGGPTTFCNGGSVVLTSSASNGNLWSTGETTRSITVTTAGTYTVQLFSDGCSSSVSTPVTTELQNCSQVFTGTGNFNNGARWAGGVAPDAGTDILVNGTMTQNINRSFNNISIAAGATITIPSGITLTVTGDLSNNGTITGDGTVLLAGSSSQNFGGGSINNLTASNSNGVVQSFATSITGTLTLGNNTTLNLNNLALTMVSSSTGTARLAAVPASASITNASNFTQQRWLDRTNVRRAGNSNGNYYLLGPVVQNQTVGLWNSVSPYSSATFNNSITGGGNFYFYNTASNAWSKPTSLSQSFPAGAGAQVWFGINNFFAGNRNVWSVSGTPVVGSFNLPLASASGFHLVSNPYPSTIDWENSNWTKTSVNPTIYIYDWVNQRYRTYIAGSGSGGIGTNGGNRYLPTAQGFIVQSTSASAVLRAAESVKVTNQVSLQRATTVTNGIIRFQMTNGTESDELVIAHNDNATVAFDQAYDAEKLMNQNTNIYVSGTVNQTIASTNMNETTIVPFVLNSRTSGLVTLTTTELNGFENQVFNIFNEQTGELLPYTPGTTYNFNVVANQPYRLQLRVGNVTGISNAIANVFEVYPNPAENNVTIRTSNANSVELVNSIGQVVIKQVAAESNVMNVSKLAKGIYTVRVIGVNGVQTQKLVVK